jgi:quercetin dioxygenase-like cupin family protein
MQIKRNGAQPSMQGPAEWFAGSVRIDPLFTAPEPGRTACASVTSEPGAGTAWHGATPATSMTHISSQEALDGKLVDWMEHVSDAQYLAGVGKRQGRFATVPRLPTHPTCTGNDP